MKLITRIIVFSILLTSSGFSRDIYVSGRLGDNRNTGHFADDAGLQDGPVRTMTRALELANPGDRIVLDPKGGPYRESVSFFGQKHGGIFDLPFIIEGQGAVLDGTEPLPGAIWKHYQNDIYRFQLLIMPQVDWTYFQIFDDDKPLPRKNSVEELEPNSWCIADGFVCFRTETNKAPMFDSDYKILYSKQKVGISLIQVHNVRIHDLKVRGFQIDGISVANGAKGIVLDNVISQANGRSGLAIGGASSVYAGYCQFTANQTTQVLSLPYSKGHLFECNVTEEKTLKSDDSVLTFEKETE